MKNFILHTATEILGQHYFLINFFGSLFGAEETIFLLAMLSMQGYFPIWVTYVSCFFGFIISDIFWYSIGKTKAINFLSKKMTNKYLIQIKRTLGKITNKSLFKKLLITKFFYGIRVPTIIYISRNQTKFKEFLYNDIFVVMIWTIIIVSIGALAGKGLKIVMILFKDITLAITYTLITSLIFFAILKLMKKAISKINGKRNKPKIN